jgi:hypothetical protein
MLKRMKVWALLAAAVGGSLFHIGGCGGFLPWGTDFGSIPNILSAILREDLFG